MCSELTRPLDTHYWKKDHYTSRLDRAYIVCPAWATTYPRNNLDVLGDPYVFEQRGLSEGVTEGLGLLNMFLGPDAPLHHL